MRRFIGMAVALGLVAAVSWQVSAAQDGGGQVVICTRPGTDVRAPDAQGRCPSGYAKTTIDNSPVFERNVGKSFTVFFGLEAIQQQGDELDLEVTAAAPDGEVRSTIVQDVSAFGDFAQFTFTDPVIGGYDFGVRVIGPMDRDGDTVPFQISVHRADPLVTTAILDHLEVELFSTGADVVASTPFVYTPAPTRSPAT